MNQDFKRERRYIVMKYKDINCLCDIDKEILFSICDRINVIRANRSKKQIEAAVIEHHWPEYAYVWGLLQYRMERST